MIREEHIGPNLRRLREQRGFTLQDLSMMTSFTKGYLSKIENSGKAPPVSTLLALAKALDVDISELFGSAGAPTRFALLRRAERSSVSRDASESGYTYEPLAPNYSTKRMEPFLIRIPMTQAEDAVFRHEGEEMLFVLRGTMRFFFGEDEHHLREGDCIYFDSGVAHHGYSIGATEAECLVVIWAAQ